MVNHLEVNNKQLWSYIEVPAKCRQTDRGKLQKKDKVWIWCFQQDAYISIFKLLDNTYLELNNLDLENKEKSVVMTSRSEKISRGEL